MGAHNHNTAQHAHTSTTGTERRKDVVAGDGDGRPWVAVLADIRGAQRQQQGRGAWPPVARCTSLCAQSAHTQLMEESTHKFTSSHTASLRQRLCAACEVQSVGEVLTSADTTDWQCATSEAKPHIITITTRMGSHQHYRHKHTAHCELCTAAIGESTAAGAAGNSHEQHSCTAHLHSQHQHHSRPSDHCSLPHS